MKRLFLLEQRLSDERQQKLDGLARPDKIESDALLEHQFCKLAPVDPDRMISMQDSIVAVDEEVHSGVPCFLGTRVPVDILFEYLVAGDTVEGFLLQFPSVRREQAIGLLEQAKRQVREDANASAA